MLTDARKEQLAMLEGALGYRFQRLDILNVFIGLRDDRAGRPEDREDEQKCGDGTAENTHVCVFLVLNSKNKFLRPAGGAVMAVDPRNAGESLSQYGRKLPVVRQDFRRNRVLLAPDSYDG